MVLCPSCCRQLWYLDCPEGPWFFDPEEINRLANSFAQKSCFSKEQIIQKFESKITGLDSLDRVELILNYEQATDNEVEPFIQLIEKLLGFSRKDPSPGYPEQNPP